MHNNKWIDDKKYKHSSYTTFKVYQPIFIVVMK